MAPRILFSNDDGIDAPGLRALVIELAAAGMEVLVCAPTSERSGQSHAITLTRFLECHPRHGDVQGAAAAYAVDGAWLRIGRRLHAAANAHLPGLAAARALCSQV